MHDSMPCVKVTYVRQQLDEKAIDFDKFINIYIHGFKTSVR